MPWRPFCRATRDSSALPRMQGSEVRRNPSRLVPLLRTSGCCRIDGVLSARTAKATLDHANFVLEAAISAVKEGSVKATRLFSEHLLYAPDQSGKRHDTYLSLSSPAVRHAIREILSSLHGVYAELLGPDAELFELSAVASDPGTPQQARHADFPDWPEEEDDEVGPMVLVLFVALDSLVPRMGPTEFLPGSHTRSYHKAREGGAVDSSRCPGHDATRAGHGYCAPLLRRGDAILMDAACFHAGRANTLRRRTLFHLSFARKGFQPSGFASYAQSLLLPPAAADPAADAAAGAEDVTARGSHGAGHNTTNVNAAPTTRPRGSSGSGADGTCSDPWATRGSRRRLDEMVQSLCSSPVVVSIT